MRIFRRLLYLLLLLAAGSSSSQAQVPVVWVESPSSGATGIAANPVITIRSNYPIIPSSISWRLYANDSTLPLKDPHTVLLIPNIIASHFSDSVYDRFAVEGSYNLVNDTTLTFTPHGDLDYFEEYTVKVRGIKLQVGLDSQSVSSLPLNFTTLPATHKVMYTSISDNSSIRCRDTIRVIFNRPIASLSTPSGNLVDMVRLDSVSGGSYWTTSVLCNISVDPADNRQVRISPQGSFPPGGSYFMYVNAGDITGDSLDSRRYSFSVRSSYKLALNSISADTSLDLASNRMTSPPSGLYYHAPGENVLIGALDDDSTHVFHHWVCPQLPLIHMSTNPVITISQGCFNMEDLNLTAVYQTKKAIEVEVESDGCTMMQVFSSNGTSLGGPGTYTVQKDDYLIVNTYNSSFLGAPTCLFKKWDSDDSRVHGKTAPMVRFYNRGTNATLGVESEPIGLLNRNNGVCIYRFIDDGFSINRETAEYQGGEDATDIIEISPNPCEFVGNSITPISATATIAEEYRDCFCLDSVIIRDPYNGLTRQSLGCVNSHTASVTPTTPSTSVYYIAKRKGSSANYNLTVETEVSNVKPLSGYGPGEASKRIGPKRDVTVQVWRRNKTGAFGLPPL